MNARELHDFLNGSIWLVAPEESNQSTILRALDLLARTEESTDELVRRLIRCGELAGDDGIELTTGDKFRCNYREEFHHAAATIVALNENCAMLKRTVENQDAYIAALKAERDQAIKRTLDAVEQKLHNWRQRTMNKSGDRLALDDFMGKESIADLIDYVCDEFADFPKDAS